ncbi:hypothetical protein PROPEN_00558 [Proteus penneri ATCC 35198]|nr:hypothetical protein PROPEN_00558 [Proteus penneri ATCC 35198]
MINKQKSISCTRKTLSYREVWPIIVFFDPSYHAHYRWQIMG